MRKQEGMRAKEDIPPQTIRGPEVGDSGPGVSLEDPGGCHFRTWSLPGATWPGVAPGERSRKMAFHAEANESPTKRAKVEWAQEEIDEICGNIDVSQEEKAAKEAEEGAKDK